MKTDLFDQKNNRVGTVELPDDIFGIPWKPLVVASVLRAQLANRRSPWAHAKDRSEVRGGGKKPWRQKGTGRARHGSIRSPLWRGGGKAHGPEKERDYSLKVNKKTRQLAIRSILSRKLSDKEVKVLDTLAIGEPKTKTLVPVLRTLLNLSAKQKKFDLVLIPEGKNMNLSRAASNLTKTKVLSPQSCNVYDLLNHKHIVIDQGAIPALHATYGSSQKKNEIRGKSK